MTSLRAALLAAAAALAAPSCGREKPEATPAPAPESVSAAPAAATTPPPARDPFTYANYEQVRVTDLALEHQIKLAARVLVLHECIGRSVRGDAIEHQFPLPLPRQSRHLQPVAEVAPGQSIQRHIVKLNRQEIVKRTAQYASAIFRHGDYLSRLPNEQKTGLLAQEE